MHERIQEIREAITHLRALLDTQDTSEDDFQEWFESNPVVFDSLNYQDHVSHPRLPLPDDDSFVPDIMGKNTKEEWEIIELKKPDTKIIKDKERRQTFYASLNNYVQQCFDYSKYFNEEVNRDRFEEENGFRIEGRPKSILVAGRNEGIDRRKVFEKLGDRGHWVDVYTYDDILNYLQKLKSKSFVEYEGLPGLSIHFAMIPLNRINQHRNQILMIGKSISRNMISIYFDIRGNLVFDVANNDGSKISTSVSREEGNFEFNNFMYFQFELGLGGGYSTMSIEVNGVYNSFNVIDRIDLDIDLEKIPFVLGSDCHGNRNSGFGIYEWFIYEKTMDLKFKMKFLRDVLGHYLKRPSESKVKEDMPIVLFEDGQFMHSENHPNFQ